MFFIINWAIAGSCHSEKLRHLAILDDREPHSQNTDHCQLQSLEPGERDAPTTPE